MSKIDAETLGDAAVGEARDALKTFLVGANGTGGNGTLKGEMDKIDGKLSSNIEDAGAELKAAANKIKTDIEAFEGKPEYQNLSDAVKKEFIALKSLATDLKASSDKLANGPVPEDFKTAFEDFNKTFNSITDLNAAQTADLNEMRGKLQSFVASPEGADTKLDSTNFTAFIDTLDTALSKISDQRAKLGASQNRLEYTINNLQVSSINLTL